MEEEGALLQLPPDALLAVLGKLGPQDLLRCACCCRLLSVLCVSDCLWMTLCNRWHLLLNLPAWRTSFDSAFSLFRILSSLDRFVGLWTAQGQQPRGSLLYVTWGTSCLVACEVSACPTGELKLVKVLEIFDSKDGSFRVELLSKDPQNITLAGVRLPGKLVWDPMNTSEFTVEANEQMQGFAQIHNRMKQVAIKRVVRCSYGRLTVEEAAAETDLVGLWMGVYGSHGVEIIHVTQRDEWIFGTKVLGDPNVPCGEVSFRANANFETCDVPVELQQTVDVDLQMRNSSRPFQIVKMFEGYGQIADDNFQNPLWVPGRLLVSSNNQIAFLWEDDNFVICFEKLDLETLYQSQNHLGLIT